jgi:rubrerythrin
MTSAVEGAGATAPTSSVAVLLTHAHAIEAEAVERYLDLAGQMEAHNNPELAALFRKMAAIEQKHVDKVDEVAEDIELPRLSSWDYQWPDAEPPESTPFENVHYLMVPHQALRAALENEQRAVKFFADVAARSNDPGVRLLAEQLAEEERHHVVLLQEWINRYPAPEPTWADDMDEPVSQE